MSKALSNQLKLLRKSRSALAAGDLEEYERLNAEATAEVEEEEEVSLEPTDTEPVVEEESSEVVSSSLPPVEPPSTTSLEPIPEILPHGAIPGAGSPTFVELAEMSGEGHFMTAFAHLRDFVLENAHEGAERAGTPLKERNLESTLGAAENVGIAGAIASTGHPVAAAAATAVALYPAALTLSNEVFGTDFGSGGTGFGGDPLDPTQWIGGVVLPRTIAQNGQDDKDRKILRYFPKNSPEFRAATERLKVTELSDIIATVVQLNNPGEIASGYTNDRAYEADFLNAAGQMEESGHKVKTLKLGLDLASANEAIKDRFSDVLKRDEIKDLYLQTDWIGRLGESGVNISGPIEQLTAATMDRIRRENPRISAEELRERADKHVDTEVQLALQGHAFAEGIAIINIGDNDAIKELHEMEDRWGASYGELGRVAAQTLAPLYASMTSAPMTQRMGLMSPEQVSTESSLVSGARLTNLAPTTWWGAGAKFGYYPVVGPLLAKMGLIDPEDAVLSEEALAWMSEGGDIIDAAPQAARAFYDHLYPDAAPGSDSWNAMTAKFQKDHPFWSQAPVLAAAMIFEPDALSVMLAGTGKLTKLTKLSAKSIKYTKYIDNIDGHILPQLEEIAARLEPYSVKSTDAKGEAVYSHKDVPVELEDEMGQAIQVLTDSALKAAGDDPELQAFFQTNLLGRLKGATGEAVRANWQTSVTARRALSELKGKSAKDTDDALQAAGLELRALEAGGKAADGILDISTTKLRMVVESLRDVMPEFFEGNNLNVAAVKNLSRKGLQEQIERATRETQESAKAVETVVHNNSAAMAAETVMFARLQKQKALLEQAHDIAKRGLGVGDEVEVITGGALDAGKFVEYKDVDGVKRAFVRIETEEGSVVKHYAIKDVAFDLHGVIRKLNPAHGARTSAAGLRFRDLARASFFKETEGAYTAADGSIWVPASSLGSLKEGQTVRWLDNGELQSVDEMTVRSTHTLKDGTETATIFAGKKAKPGMTVAVDLDQVYVLRHRDAGGQLEGILSLLEARARASTMHRGEEVTEEAINAWYARNFKGFATDLKGEVKPLVDGSLPVIDELSPYGVQKNIWRINQRLKNAKKLNDVVAAQNDKAEADMVARLGRALTDEEETALYVRIRGPHQLAQKQAEIAEARQDLAGATGRRQKEVNSDLLNKLLAEEKKLQDDFIDILGEKEAKSVLTEGVDRANKAIDLDIEKRSEWRGIPERTNATWTQIERFAKEYAGGRIPKDDPEALQFLANYGRQVEEATAALKKTGDDAAAQGDLFDDIMYQGPATAGATTAEEAVEAARLWKELGTESPYFKKWFGDSKMVGEDGKPLTLYHGGAQGVTTLLPAGGPGAPKGSAMGAGVQSVGRAIYTSMDGQEARRHASMTAGQQLRARTGVWGNSPVRGQTGMPDNRNLGLYKMYARLESPLDLRKSMVDSPQDVKNLRAILQEVRRLEAARKDPGSAQRAGSEEMVEHLDYIIKNFEERVADPTMRPYSGEPMSPKASLGEMFNEDGLIGSTMDLSAVFKKYGYDGVISDPKWNVPEVVVFDSNQVKSSIAAGFPRANRGTFDETGRILYQGADEGVKHGDSYFDADKLSRLRDQVAQYGERETLVYLTPDEFLSMAARLSAPRETSVATVSKALSAGKKFYDIPFLRMKEDGTIFGHEGRHRAMALKALGVKRMPVRLMSDDIRWNEQLPSKMMEGGQKAWYWRETLPKQLTGQDGVTKMDAPFHAEGPNRGQVLPERRADLPRQGADEPASVDDIVKVLFQDAEEVPKILPDPRITGLEAQISRRKSTLADSRDLQGTAKSLWEDTPNEYFGDGVMDFGISTDLSRIDLDAADYSDATKQALKELKETDFEDFLNSPEEILRRAEELRSSDNFYLLSTARHGMLADAGTKNIVEFRRILEEVPEDLPAREGGKSREALENGNSVRTAISHVKEFIRKKESIPNLEKLIKEDQERLRLIKSGEIKYADLKDIPPYEASMRIIPDYKGPLQTPLKPLPPQVRAYHSGGKPTWREFDPRGPAMGSGENFPGGGVLGLGTYFSTADSSRYLKYGGATPSSYEVVLDTTNMVGMQVRNSPARLRFNAVMEKYGLGDQNPRSLFKKVPRERAYELLDEANVTGYYEMVGAKGHEWDEVAVFTPNTIRPVQGETFNLGGIAKVLYQDEGAKAAVQFVEDNKAILYAFEQADVSSLLHEIGHVFRRDLLRSGWQGKLDSDVLVRAFTTKDDRHIGDTVTFDGGEGVGWTDLTKAGKTRTPEEMDKIQGKRSRKRKAALDKRARGLEAQSGPATWTVKSEERFTRAIEKYLATGRSPSLELDGVFKKFKSWMTEIYVKIRGSAIGRDIPKEVREVFDRMLTGAMTTEGYMKTFTVKQLRSKLDEQGIVYKGKDKKESLAKRLSAADRNRTVDYQKFLDRQKSTAERIATLAPAQAKLVKSLEDELKPLEAKSNKAQKALLKERKKFNKALNRRNTAKRKLILRNVYDEQKSGEKVVLSTQDALIKFRGNPTAKAADHLTKQLAKIDQGNKKISGNNLLAGVEGSIKDLKVMIEVLKKEQMVRPVRRNLMTHPILKSVIRDRTKGTWVIDPKAFVDSVDEFYVSGVLEEFLATPEGLFLVPIVTAARQGNVKLTYTKAQMNRLQKTLKAMEGQYRAGDLSREAMGRFLQMKMSYQNPTAKSIRVPVPFSDMLGGKGVLVGVPGSATKRFWHFYNVFDPTYSKLGKISPKIAKIASKQTRFVEHGLGDMHNLNMTHMGEDFLGAHVGYMDSTKAIKGRYGSTTVNTMGNGIFKEAQNFIMSNIKLTKKGRATFAEDDAGQYTKSLINALERTFLGNPELKLQPRISEAQATKLRSKVLELLGDESMTYDKFLRELGKAAGRSDFGRQDARGIMMSSRALLDAAGWQHTLRAMANTTNAMLTPQEALTMTRFMEGEMDKASDVDLLWSAAAKLGMDLSEGTIRAGTKHGQGERARVKSLVKWNLDDGRTLTPEELVAHNTKLEATLKEKGVSPEDIEAQLIVSGQKITDPRQVFMPSQIGDSMKDSNRSFVKELDQYYSNPKGFDPQGSLAKFVRYWKGMITSGLGLPRPKYYVNNILGDFSQMWQNHGIYTSAKVSAQNVLTNMPYIGPRIQNVTSKMAEKFEGIPILSTAVEAIFSPQIGRIFTGEEGVIKLGDETVSLSTLRENLALDGVLDTFTSREVSVNVNQVAMELLGDAEKKYGRSIPGKFKDIVGRKMKHDVDGFAVQVQQRQRVGLYLELRKQGLDHDGAVKGVKDALYDWSQGFSSWEQSWQMGLVIPFYRFWRLAAGQMIRAFMEPFVMDSSDYMLKALTGQTQLARMKTQGRILAGIPKWAAYAEAEEAPEGEEDEVFWDGILAKPWWIRPGMTYAGKQATQRQKDFMLGDHDRDIDTVATAMSAPMTAAEMYTIGTYILTTPFAAAAAAMDEDKEFNGLRSYKQLEKFAVDIGGPLVEALLKEKRTSKTGYRRISPGQESALKLLGDAADVHRDEDGRLVADEWALAFVNNLPVIGSQWADGVNGMEWSKLYYEDEELFDRILYMLGHISGPVRDYPSSTDDTLSFAHKDVIKHLKTAADKQKVGDDPKEKYKRMNE